MDGREIQYAWTRVCNRIQTYDDINASQMTAMFSRIHPMAMSEDFLMLTADNDFIKAWIKRNYLGVIHKALKEEFGNQFTVVIEVDLKDDDNQPSKQTASQLASFNEDAQTGEPQLPAEPAATLPSQPKEEEPQQTAFDNTNASYSFENFVIGDSNRLAYSMALAVAESPGKTHLNPLFIYGKSGLGKTHLLRAIQNYIHQNHPYLNVIYIDSQQFTVDFTEAATAHDRDKSSFKTFKDQYEDADVLLIDDVQYFQGKIQTSDIVFQLFNRLVDQGKQIVLSADRAPKNIGVEERLKSRFNSGGTFDITAPEIETKLGIIKKYIDDFKENETDCFFIIPDDVQIYIAEISSSNIRELKSAVNKIIFHITYSNRDTITIEEVRKLLENHFTHGATGRLSISDIQKAASEFYKVSQADMVGKKRQRNITHARQVAIYLSRNLLDCSHNEIGRHFNRDHATVMYSVTCVETKLKESRDLQEEIEAIKKIIKDM